MVFYSLLHGHLPKDGVVVWGCPKAGAGVEEPNKPPVAVGWGVDPNKELPPNPNTLGEAPKLVVGLLNVPKVLGVPVPNPPVKKVKVNKPALFHHINLKLQPSLLLLF